MGRDREAGTDRRPGPQSPQLGRRRLLRAGAALLTGGAALTPHRGAGAASSGLPAVQMPLRLLGPAPPPAPLSLPPWRYGGISAAADTVLMFRGNPTHTFYGTGPLPDSPRLHWSLQTESYPTVIHGQPVLWAGTGWTGQAVKLGDYVFVGAVDRTLYALLARTGEVKWRYRARGMFKSSLCVFENRLYIGNVDDFVRCIVPGSNGSETSPAVEGGEFYTGTYDGFLYCLDSATGWQRWRFATGDDTDVSPVLSADLVYIATEEEHPSLFCLRRKTGKEVWRVTTGGGYWSTPAVVGDRLWIGGQDAHLSCLSATTGAQRWDTRVGRAIWSSPCVVDNRVVFGSYDHFLYMLDADTGKVTWRYDLDGACVSTPCIVDGHIYIGNASGTFFCFGP